MKLEELLGISNLGDMPTEDLQELLRQVRHNRTTEETIAQKAERKSTRKAAEKLISGLSPDELAAIKKMMLKES